jgi:hypothetical protein
MQAKQHVHHPRPSESIRGSVFPSRLSAVTNQKRWCPPQSKAASIPHHRSCGSWRDILPAALNGKRLGIHDHTECFRTEPLPCVRPTVGSAGRAQAQVPLWMRGSTRTVPEDRLVGAAGFEPTASSSRTKRATRLRYAPTSLAYRPGAGGREESMISGRGASRFSETAAAGLRFQNSQWPGVRAKGMTSRMLPMPVTNISRRSKPRPNPAWGTVPYFRRSAYHE